MFSKLIISALKFETDSKFFFSIYPIRAYIKFTSKQNFYLIISGKTGISKRKWVKELSEIF